MRESKPKKQLVIESIRMQLSREHERAYLKRLKTLPNMHGQQIFSPKRIYYPSVDAFSPSQDYSMRKKSILERVLRWKTVENAQEQEIRGQMHLKQTIDLPISAHSLSPLSHLAPSISELYMQARPQIYVKDFQFDVNPPMFKQEPYVHIRRQSDGQERSKGKDCQARIEKAGKKGKQLLRSIQKEIIVRPLSISINLPQLAKQQQQASKFAKRCASKLKPVKPHRKCPDISPWASSHLNTDKDFFKQPKN